MAGIILLGLLTAMPAMAQKKSKAEVKISEIKADAVKTPDFKASEESTKDHWGRFRVKFDLKSAGTADGWLSEMDIVWKVLAIDNAKKAKIFTLTVSYQDVKEESGQYACIYLKPNFIKRYMSATGTSSRFNAGDFSVYCEFQVNGQRVGAFEKTVAKHAALGKWYTKDGDKERSERYLIPRFRSPFSVIDYDFYINEKVSD